MVQVKWDKFEILSIKYRQVMTTCLEKVILLMKKRILSPQKVDEFQRKMQVEEFARKFSLYEDSLLITKAHIHLLTAQYANKKDNIHSLAIHLRVVLECAGQIARKVHNIASKNPNESSIRLSEYQIVMSRMTWHIPNLEDKKVHLSSIRDTVADLHADFASFMNVNVPITKWRYSETVNHLEFGNNWYNHISKYFCHSDIKDLKSTSYTGGVLTNNLPFDIYMFAFLLDYLVHQSLVMIMNSAVLESDDCLLNKSAKLLTKKKTKSSYYNKELNKCKRK